MTPEHVLAGGERLDLGARRRPGPSIPTSTSSSPTRSTSPTRPSRTRWASDRPADELIDDVLDAAAGSAGTSVSFFELSDATRPAGPRAAAARAGRRAHRDPRGPRPRPHRRGPRSGRPHRPRGAPGRPPWTTLRATDRIDVEVFGGRMLTRRRSPSRPRDRPTSHGPGAPRRRPVGARRTRRSPATPSGSGARRCCPGGATPVSIARCSTAACARAPRRAATSRWSRAGSRPRLRSCSGPGSERFGEVRAYRLARG